jgi:succinate-acetate transporter protein
MEVRIANARALGFASFAAGTWMYSMALAGWFPDTVLDSPTMASVVAAVALGLFIAGLASFLRNDHWAAFFFTWWAVLWWGIHVGAGVMGEESNTYAGWYFATIAVVNVILFLAAMRDPEALPVRLVSLAIAVGFVSWAVGAWEEWAFFVALAGYIGLVTALAAYWAAAREALTGEIGGGGAKGATAPPAAGTT